jgi:hypothetical protein
LRLNIFFSKYLYNKRQAPLRWGSHYFTIVNLNRCGWVICWVWRVNGTHEKEGGWWWWIERGNSNTKNSKEWIRWKEFKWLWWGRCRCVKGQDDTQPKLSGNEGPTCEVDLFVVARVLQKAGMLVHVSLGSVIAPRYLHFPTPPLSHVNSTHSCLLSLSPIKMNQFPLAFAT